MTKRKSLNTTHLLVTLLLACLVPRPARTSYTCNTKLLHTFRLKGLKYSVAEEMEICPTVRDTCCSMFDQVEILQLWRKTSFIRVQNHYLEMIKWDEKVIKMYKKFRRLSKSDMVFHYMEDIPTPYNYHFCMYKKTPIEAYPANVIAKNLDYMLPGVGPIEEVDVMDMRREYYEKIKREQADKDDPIYRFKLDSAGLFYKEFRLIANLMYQSRRMPYYHKKLIDIQRQFDNVSFSGKYPGPKKLQLPADKIINSPARAKMRAQRKSKFKKPKIYKFTDYYTGDRQKEINALYKKKGGRKGGRRRRKKKGRKLDSAEQGKTQSGGEGDNYADAPMEELKVKRRKKRLAGKKSGGKGGEGGAEKSLMRYKRDPDLKRGRHRRKLTKKHFKRRRNRKLKDLKGQISQQWNSVFGQGAHPELPANIQNPQPVPQGKPSPKK